MIDTERDGVQDIVLNNIGKIIYYIGWNVLEKHMSTFGKIFYIIDSYSNMEIEQHRINVARNAPAIASVLPVENFKESFYDVYMRLAKDGMNHEVRRIIAASIHEMFKIFDPRESIAMGF